MLTKKYRLKSAEEIKNVLKNGRFVRGDFINIKLKANGLSETRVAFVVGAHVAKESAVRNRIKRRLRAIVAKQINSIKKGFDVVVLTERGIKEKKFQEISGELESVLKSGGLL